MLRSASADAEFSSNNFPKKNGDLRDENVIPSFQESADLLN